MPPSWALTYEPPKAGLLGPADCHLTTKMDPLRRLGHQRAAADDDGAAFLDSDRAGLRIAGEHEPGIEPRRPPGIEPVLRDQVDAVVDEAGAEIALPIASREFK